MAPLRYFLLIYDTAEQQLVETRDLGEIEGEAAADCYTAVEEQFRDDRTIEVVLIQADSVESIRKTHGHYFPDDDRVDFFAAVTAD